MEPQFVDREHTCEVFLPLFIIKKYLEIISTADAVVVLAGGAYMQVFLEFKGRAGVFALRAPGPETIGGLFLFGGGGTDTFLYTAEPAACGFRLSMGRGF